MLALAPPSFVELSLIGSLKRSARAGRNEDGEGERGAGNEEVWNREGAAAGMKGKE